MRMAGETFNIDMCYVRNVHIVYITHYARVKLIIE